MTQSVVCVSIATRYGMVPCHRQGSETRCSQCQTADASSETETETHYLRGELQHDGAQCLDIRLIEYAFEAGLIR